MTIGRNSRKTSTRSSIRAPKFLDKSSGFYGRLDEPEPATDDGCEISGGNVEAEVKDGSSYSTMAPNTLADEDVDGFGAIEDDGETLLRRKPSRLSSRWRRSTSRKQKDEKVEEDQTQNEKSSPEVQEDKMKVKTEEETVKEPGLVHFQVREFADDRVLIRDNKRGREKEEEESEEERKMKKEQEEGMKMVKRKNYRKVRLCFCRFKVSDKFHINAAWLNFNPVKGYITEHVEQEGKVLAHHWLLITKETLHITLLVHHHLGQSTAATGAYHQHSNCHFYLYLTLNGS